jgi:hypothetical protein
MEYKEALHSWNCNDLEELQRAIALSNLQWRQATQNRFVYACFLAHMLQITLLWEPFPWANLFLPGHIPPQRFLCTSIQEESDTAFLQDSSGSVTLINFGRCSLAPPCARFTAQPAPGYTVKEL